MMDENVSMGDALIRAFNACNAELQLAQADAQENESLARERVDWDAVVCIRTEVFHDSEGRFGWRCFVRGLTPRLSAYIADRMRNAGWQGAEVHIET